MTTGAKTSWTAARGWPSTLPVDAIVSTGRSERKSSNQNDGVMKVVPPGTTSPSHAATVETSGVVMDHGAGFAHANSPEFIQTLIEGSQPLVVRIPVRGGLAPWQERRAKEMLSAHLGKNVLLAELAAACRLSVSHFARAFRQTTGVTPHQWLIQCRVERAMELMRDCDRELSDIALVCGFADQSHFTRIFARAVGLPPGTWRRGLDHSNRWSPA